MFRLSTSKRYQPDGQGQDDVRLSTQVLTRGKDHTVSFAGTSQFTAQGVSACGLAAFNFARIGFRIEQSKENLTDVLNELSTREVIEVSMPSGSYRVLDPSMMYTQEIIAICSGWSSNLHLEVDDIHNLPIFNRSLRLMSVEYGRPRPKHFQILLECVHRMYVSAGTTLSCFSFPQKHEKDREIGCDDHHASTRDYCLFQVCQRERRSALKHTRRPAFRRL